jgi:hypothetical protein
VSARRPSWSSRVVQIRVVQSETAFSSLLVVEREGRRQVPVCSNLRIQIRDPLLRSANRTQPTLPGHIVSLSRRLIDEVKDLRRQAAATAAAPPEISASGLADRGERRRRMSKAHFRFTTTTPATPPASLICPLCDRPLAHDRSYVGGVSDRQSEQWDYYMCPTCGPFQYRQRTRKLHRVDSVP